MKACVRSSADFQNVLIKDLVREWEKIFHNAKCQGFRQQETEGVLTLHGS